jgi:hypothetical protein
VSRAELKETAEAVKGAAPAVFCAADMIISAVQKPVSKVELSVSSLEKSISAAEMNVPTTDRIASWMPIIESGPEMVVCEASIAGMRSEIIAFVSGTMIPDTAPITVSVAEKIECLTFKKSKKSRGGDRRGYSMCPFR